MAEQSEAERWAGATNETIAVSAIYFEDKIARIEGYNHPNGLDRPAERVSIYVSRSAAITPANYMRRTGGMARFDPPTVIEVLASYGWA